MTVVIIYVVMLFLTYLKGAKGSCADQSGADQSKVATMCHNSVLQGTSVFIDTSATTTLAQGVACTCQVDVQTGKQVDVNVYYGQPQITNCGSLLKFTHNVSTLETPCGNYTDNFQTSQFTNITVDLIKSREDGIVDYCTQLILRHCQANEFQCDDLTCIESELVCDGVGECNDDSDEANCNPVICNENFVRCGDTCISKTDTCNNTVNGNGTAGTPPPPLITITCEESPYLPQDTTTVAQKTPTTSTVTTRQSTVSTGPSTSQTTSKPKGGDDDDDDNNDDNDDHIIIIIGVICGCVVLLLIFLAIYGFIIKQRRNDQDGPMENNHL